MSYFGLGEGSSLVGIIRMYFTLVFGSGFISGFQCVGCCNFTQLVSILVGDLEFSIDIFEAVFSVFIVGSFCFCLIYIYTYIYKTKMQHNSSKYEPKFNQCNIYIYIYIYSTIKWRLKLS